MRLVELGCLAKIDRTPATDDEVLRLPFVGLEHIEKGTGNFIDDNVEVSADELLATKFRFTPSHVLYGKLRPNLNKVALPNFEGVCTTELLPLLPDPSLLDRTYLWGALLHSDFVKWASHIVQGANLPRLSPTDLAQYQIPMPDLPPAESLAEQRRIAAILSAADGERRRRRYIQSAQSDRFAQDLFVEMFGDPATNPMGWETVPLARLCDKIIDCLHATPRFATGETEYACIRSSDIQNGYLDWTTTKYLDEKEYRRWIQRGKPQRGDIFFCREGARLANAARINTDRKVALGQRMMLFRVKGEHTTTEFLWAFLESNGIKKLIWNLVGGSASPHVNISDLRKIQVVAPPLDMQCKFSESIRVHDIALQIEKEIGSQTDHLFQSLLDRAFRGEL